MQNSLSNYLSLFYITKIAALDKPLLPITTTLHDHHHDNHHYHSMEGKTSGQKELIPVLVLFHGLHNNDNNDQENKANTFTYLPVVKATKSLVITFNYRIGLLGK